jgi:hypothetical protein
MGFTLTPATPTSNQRPEGLGHKLKGSCVQFFAKLTRVLHGQRFFVEKLDVLGVEPGRQPGGRRVAPGPAATRKRSSGAPDAQACGVQAVGYSTRYNVRSRGQPAPAVDTGRIGGLQEPASVGPPSRGRRIWRAPLPRVQSCGQTVPSRPQARSCLTDGQIFHRLGESRVPVGPLWRAHSRNDLNGACRIVHEVGTTGMAQFRGE